MCNVVIYCQQIHLVTDCTGQWPACPFCQEKGVTKCEEVRVPWWSTAGSMLEIIIWLC